MSSMNFQVCEYQKRSQFGDVQINYSGNKKANSSILGAFSSAAGDQSRQCLRSYKSYFQLYKYGTEPFTEGRGGPYMPYGQGASSFFFFVGTTNLKFGTMYSGTMLRWESSKTLRDLVLCNSL